MTVQIATTTQSSNSFLGGGAQRRVAFLCDGSLAVLFHNGTAWSLLQVTNPNSASPVTQVVGGYPGQSTPAAIPDMYVLNTGTTSSELWFTDTQANLAVVHAVYTAASGSWSWSARNSVAASTNAALWSQITWTGTYLIELHQDAAGGNFAVFCNWTTDRTGTSGWQAAQVQVGSVGASTRTAKPVLLHDSALGATVAIYPQGAVQPVGIFSRVLPDALSPDLANWGPETSLGVTANTTLGGQYDDEDAQAGVIDPASKRVHYLYCDSTTGAPRSPGYLTATVTVDTQNPINNVATWSAPVTVDTDRAASMASIAVDSSGLVYVYWCTEPTSSTGDVKYASIAAPYQQTSVITNLTNTLSNNNQGSHIPQQVLGSGFVPLVYGIGTTVNGSAPPWKILLDTSVPNGSPSGSPPPPPPPPPAPPAVGAPDLVATSSNTAALALGTQRRAATLADGTLAVLDFDGSSTHLYQVSAAASTNPTVTSVRQFANMGSFYALPDLHVANNPDGSSDIWIADTTTVASITHGRYAPATRSWSWDPTNAVPGSTGAAFYVNVAWTGSRLIVAYNDGAPHALYYNWTTDPTGASGWSSEGSVKLSTGSNTNVRPAPVLVHDAGVGATVCLYFIGTQVISRVLADALTPVLSNWGVEQNVVTAGVEVALTYAYPYFNNHVATIDARTGSLHYVFCDSGSGPASPGYMLGAVAVNPSNAAGNTIQWSSPVAIGTPLRTASSPQVGVDGSSKVYVAWATSPGSGSSDVMYTILTAPYTSAPAATNLTNNASGNNMQPHIPRGESLSGYVPIVYVSAGTSAWGTSSPWAVVLDNTLLTATRSTVDTPSRFRIAAPVRGLTDVHSRFALVVPGVGFAADATGRFAMSARSVRDVASRFKIGLRGRVPVFTSSSNQALTLGSQRRVATLCDGSLAVLGWDGGHESLFQVTNPGTATPAVTAVQAFAALNSFYALPDLLVVNNGSATSDVWIADTTSVAAVQHGTYSAASKSWAWDVRTNVPGSSGNAFYVQLAWTGTNLICAYQDGAYAVFMNWTNVKAATSGWSSSQVQLSSSGAGSRPVIVLEHSAGLGATVAVYSINNQVVSRVLPDSLSPAVASWGPETAVVSAAVGQASTSGYAYAGNLTGLIDPATQRVHVAFCDGSSSTRSPGYVNGTVTVDAVTPANSVVHWNGPLTVGAPAASSSSPALAVDRASKIYLFWATSTGGSASDAKYATIASPYTAASAEANLTNNAAGNSTQPHVPRSEVLAGGFVPLVFESGISNPFTVFLDTSIPAG